MKFVDTVEFSASAGSGGRGCISFRREKYVPRGGPNGGNGGNGGNVIIQGDSGMYTLLDLRYKKIYKAKNGEAGRSRDQNGAAGSDLLLPVPFGTMVYNSDTGEELADISSENPKFLLLRGGRGGRGNAAFATPSHRTPRIAEDGEKGENLNIRLVLKLIADVGIIGYPNAGKSTFISKVTNARSKAADYPFTTLHPVLGVVKAGYYSYVISDMPGIIDGAHRGAGLGLQFLQHIERVRLLLHFVDSSAAGSDAMILKYQALRQELELYSQEVAMKPEIVVATKIDAAAEALNGFAEYIKQRKKPFFAISAQTGGGVAALMNYVGKLAHGN
ncbi:MAG: GTPase ObgE [Deferribacteraceae bacterium]|jgi:GTP-binding protein|nr:GTPase ObgE [Deferribacteraceae bacterium]